MSALYVNVVVDLDDGQGAPGLGPVTTYPQWNGTATVGIASVPQTVTLTGDAAPVVRVRASDDPLLPFPLMHCWQEALTNVVQNPPEYRGQINYSDGATQYLSTLRLQMLATDPPDPTIAYAPAADLAAHAATIASPTVLGHIKVGDGLDIDEDGVLSATGGGSGTVQSVADVLPDEAGNVPLAAGDIGAASVIALNAETSARQAADTTLQTNITSEASTRATADTTNATAISTHAARTDNPHSVTYTQVGAAASGHTHAVPDDTAIPTQDPYSLTTDTLRNVIAFLWDVVSTCIAALNEKLTAANNLADLPDKSAARDALELGTAATKNVGTAAGTVAAGDAVPNSHASSHISTGSDAIPAAVASGASGLLTGADKAKLDGIASGAQPGTVTAVTGTGNIASTGGTTPQLSFTGVLPVANGGTGFANKSSFVEAGFVADGSVYLRMPYALTLASPTAVPGTATGSYAIAAAATPTVFSACSFPQAFASGDVLRVTAAGVSTYETFTFTRTV